jgi:hypothetical protein
LCREKHDGRGHLQKKLHTDAEALDVSAHQMGDARMTEPRDIFPSPRRQASRDAQALRLDEIHLQRDDRAVARRDRQSPQRHEHAEQREQQREPFECRFGADGCEDRGCAMRQPARHGVGVEDQSQKRHQQRNAHAFEQRAGDDVRRRDDPSSSRSLCKIPDKRAPGDDRAFFFRHDYAYIHNVHLDPRPDHIAPSPAVDAVHKVLRGKSLLDAPGARVR